MAETIWNGLITAYNFVMDNLVIINILLSLIIIFFQRRSPQTVWTCSILSRFLVFSSIWLSDRIFIKAGCLRRKRLKAN